MPMRWWVRWDGPAKTSDAGRGLVRSGACRGYMTDRSRSGSWPKECEVPPMQLVSKPGGEEVDRGRCLRSTKCPMVSGMVPWKVSPVGQ
jgi:hypothetical protein